MVAFGAVPRSAEGDVKFFPPVSERSEPESLVREFIGRYQVMVCGHPCMYLQDFVGGVFCCKCANDGQSCPLPHCQ